MMPDEITPMEMPYRSLGRCGTKVSLLSLGGWMTYGGSVTDERVIATVLRTAFSAGVNFFDMADIYSNGETEHTMGNVLRTLPRQRLVLSSKLFWPMSQDVNDRGLSRKHIMESVNASLRRIGTDYLDLYFCHRFDAETPLEETARAMDDLIHQGKILYWGTSEWTAKELIDAVRLCRKSGLYPPQVEQPEYNLLSRAKFEKETAPTCQKLGMGLVIWSPLASGILSGKYDDGHPPGSRLASAEWQKEGDDYPKDSIERVRIMKKLAQAAGCTRAQLAIAWAASHPARPSVIMGATRLEQLKENLGALKVKIPKAIARQLNDLFPAEGLSSH